MAPANSSKPRFDRAERRCSVEATLTAKQRKINAFYSAMQQLTSLFSFFFFLAIEQRLLPLPKMQVLILFNNKFIKLKQLVFPSTKTQWGWINWRISESFHHQAASDSVLDVLDCVSFFNTQTMKLQAAWRFFLLSPHLCWDIPVLLSHL